MSELSNDILRSSDQAVAMASDRGNVLDYSEASLETVESMLAEASGYLPRLTDEQVQALVQAFGCYILEVGRRTFGGRYLWFEERQQPILMVGRAESHVAMAAWDKVRGRLSGDPGDNIPFFYQGFAERVRSPERGRQVLVV